MGLPTGRQAWDVILENLRQGKPIPSRLPGRDGFRWGDEDILLNNPYDGLAEIGVGRSFDAPEVFDPMKLKDKNFDVRKEATLTAKQRVALSNENHRKAIADDLDEKGQPQSFVGWMVG